MLRAQLLSQVEQVRSTVERGLSEADTRRALPKATVDALRSSGLFGLKVPDALGGSEAAPDVQVDVIEALSEIDGSTGWCVMIGSSSAALLGAFLPEAGVAQVFEGRIPLVAGVPLPRGSAQRSGSTYRLSGRWPFASGILHADWVVAGAMVEPVGGAPAEARVFAVPQTAVEIHDTWHVVGLRGTGSCDFSIAGVEVPEERSFALADLLSGRPQRGGQIFRMGMPGFVALESAAFALGVARRALREAAAGAAQKLRQFSAQPTAERGAFQRDLAHADLVRRAARALVVEVNGAACRGDVQAASDAGLQADLRAAATYATDVAREAVAFAFRAAGTEALFDGSAVQRCLRDVHAGAQHAVVDSAAYEGYAASLLT